MTEWTDDDVKLLITSIAVASLDSPFTEERAEQAALEVSAQMIRTFLNADDFKIEQLRQQAAGVRAQFRVMEASIALKGANNDANGEDRPGAAAPPTDPVGAGLAMADTQDGGEGGRGDDEAGPDRGADEGAPPVQGG